MQEEITSTTVETIHLSNELGQFEIEPLNSGFGLTLGNALRRVLVSSLAGAAITAVKIENVYHEFSTIPGVREDTTELILNLKQVRLKSYTEDPVNVRLEASGPGVVTAGDIQVPPEIEIANPELRLATLDDQDARLDLVLTVEKGRGYITADGRETPAIGVIPIDAIFTPIRRVNYRVEKTRVGARTDYDKLMIEIQTDGCVGPKEALVEASQILIEQFQIFPAQLGGIPVRSDRGAIAPSSIASNLQDMPIEDLDLSSRTYNCLKRSQITTIGQLLRMNEDELLGLRNFGQKSLQELHEKLALHGIIPPDDGAGRVEAPPFDMVQEDEEAGKYKVEEEEEFGRVKAYADDYDFEDEDDRSSRRRRRPQGSSRGE